MVAVAVADLPGECEPNSQPPCHGASLQKEHTTRSLLPVGLECDVRIFARAHRQLNDECAHIHTATPHLSTQHNSNSDALHPLWTTSTSNEEPWVQNDGSHSCQRDEQLGQVNTHGLCGVAMLGTLRAHALLAVPQRRHHLITELIKLEHTDMGKAQVGNIQRICDRSVPGRNHNQGDHSSRETCHTRTHRQPHSVNTHVGMNTQRRGCERTW